ncbi:hypothetical protein [Pseudosulfitobacter pseudonitzschiae]|uniref:ribonuclease toxin HepT-like protein n=1 Tax=Pseudosulfitobacter pseudonitzschiae TaxID=1402135 RepID=UPI003B812B1D
MNLLEDFLSENPLDSDKSVMKWGAVGMIAFTIHNIYNGFEDVMKVICKEVDGHTPGGESSHQDILNQLKSELPDVRPPVLKDELYKNLTDLKAFRHRVNHNYANELIEIRVLEKLDLLRATYPMFLTAMYDLDRNLLPPSNDKEDEVDNPFPS